MHLLITLIDDIRAEKQNLNSIQWDITSSNCSNNINYKSSNVNSELKLDEFLDVSIYGSAPSDNLHLAR